MSSQPVYSTGVLQRAFLNHIATSEGRAGKMERGRGEGVGS
jgi:hypothetical protein